MRKTALNKAGLGAAVVVWLVGASGCIEVKQEARDATAGDVAGLDVPDDDIDVPDGGPDTSLPGDVPSVDADVPPDLPPCSPPLTVTPEAVWLEPGASIDVVVAGGNGGYVSTVGAEVPDFLVNPDPESAGVFALKAGEESPASSFRIVFGARGCSGTAAVQVELVQPFELQPETIRIPLQTSFTYAITDGSGDFRFELQPGPSCGMACGIDAIGRFTSDKTEGTFGVQVTDTRTGRTLAGTVIVAEDARLVSQHLFRVLPPGWYGPAGFSGGSGDLQVQLSPGAPFELEDDNSLTATGSEGAATLTVTDRWTGAVTTQHLEIAAVTPVEYATTPPVGAQWVLASADINADGWLDLVVGMPEHTSKRAGAGMVQVFIGSEDGFQGGPVQILESHERDAQLGRSVALANVVGDANVDLIVGAPGVDGPTQPDMGMVAVHMGLGDGRFAEDPTVVYRGPQSTARFGSRVAVCDINADQHLDIIVTAPNAWLITSPGRVPGQGAFHVYLGTQAGLPVSAASPGATRHAVEGSGTAWYTPTTDRLEMGLALAVGDVNDDGACDIALGSSVVGSDQGRVWLYRGVPGGSAEAAVEAVPAWLLAGAFAGARLGSAVAMGDIDGDGFDDLFASEPGWSGVGTPTATGRVRHVPGYLLKESNLAQVLPQGTSNITHFVGASAGDGFGTALGIRDVTGDGAVDLIVGAPRAMGVGTVQLFAGATDASISRSAARTWYGRAADDQLGVAVAPSGAVVASPTNPEAIRLAGIAGGSSSWGPSAGGLFDLHLASANQPSLSEVPMLVNPHPWGIGQGLAVLPDLDNDGNSELWIGAPTAPASGQARLREAGQVFWQRPWQTPVEALTSVPSTPATDWLQGGDRFGQDIAWVGDFDGDERGEVAVLSRFDDYPATPPTAWAGASDACNSSLVNAGAILLFSIGEDGFINTYQPSTILFPATPNLAIERIIGIGDFNGDGLADVMGAAPAFNFERGRIVVWHGRARTAPDTAVLAICGVDRSYDGAEAGDRFGTSPVALGPVNADVCDDIAVGAPGFGPNDGGSVYLIGGGGTRCNSFSPRLVRVSQGGDVLRFGHMLAADNIGNGAAKEMIIGAPNTGAGQRGSVWLVSESRLAQILDEGYASQDSIPAIALSVAGKAPVLRLTGTVAGERLGTVVGLVPQSGATPPVVVVGRQNVDGVDGWADVTLRFHDATLMPAVNEAPRAWAVTTEPRGVMSLGVHHADELTDVKIVPSTAMDGGVIIGVPGSSYSAVDMGVVFRLKLDGWRALFSAQ